MTKSQRVGIAAAVLGTLVGTTSQASAQLFRLVNDSDSDVSIGLGVTDETCASNFRDNLWVNLQAHDTRELDIDLSNPILLTAIVVTESGGRTLGIRNSGNLGRYDWDTPLRGSNECSTFNGVKAGERFGYATYDDLSGVCPLGVRGMPGVRISDEQAGSEVRAWGAVGCISFEFAPPPPPPPPDGDNL